MSGSSAVRTLLGIALILFAAGAIDSRIQTARGNPRQDFLDKLVAAAIERTHHTVKYVSDYVRLNYPGGDVPSDTGVCSDEIIRVYRVVDVDLQKEVHEDMVKNWS